MLRIMPLVLPQEQNPETGNRGAGLAGVEAETCGSA